MRQPKPCLVIVVTVPEDFAEDLLRSTHSQEYYPNTQHVHVHVQLEHDFCQLFCQFSVCHLEHDFLKIARG